MSNSQNLLKCNSDRLAVCQSAYNTFARRGCVCLDGWSCRVEQRGVKKNMKQCIQLFSTKGFHCNLSRLIRHTDDSLLCWNSMIFVGHNTLIMRIPRQINCHAHKQKLAGKTTRNCIEPTRHFRITCARFCQIQTRSIFNDSSGSRHTSS